MVLIDNLSRPARASDTSVGSCLLIRGNKAIDVLHAVVPQFPPPGFGKLMLVSRCRGNGQVSVVAYVISHITIVVVSTFSLVVYHFNLIQMASFGS